MVRHPGGNPRVTASHASHNITNHIREINGNTAQGFLKACWDGQDPSHERPFIATTEGLHWQDGLDNRIFDEMLERRPADDIE